MGIALCGELAGRDRFEDATARIRVQRDRLTAKFNAG
jgi:hypothetical protein